MKNGRYAYCVSTIVNKETMKKFAAEGLGQISESNPWKTGAALLLEAYKIGVEMPIIFSDAAYDTETLLYHATLRRVDIDNTHTKVKFDNFKRIRGEHNRSDLTLRSTGKKIKKKYIRPYAICETPEWLR